MVRRAAALQLSDFAKAVGDLPYVSPPPMTPYPLPYP